MSWAPWAILSILLVIGTPIALVGGLYLHHALTYDGMCGPYAPDIAAHPCSYEIYMEGFLTPFAAAGLMVLAIAATLGASLLVAFAWGVGVVVWALRRRT